MIKKILRMLASGEIKITNEKTINHLSKDLVELKADNRGILELPRSTLIVGNGIYNNTYHPAEEIKKSYKSMEGQPWNIDHNYDIEYEIGFMKDVQYDEDTMKMSAIPVLNLNTAKGIAALEHIRNRMYSGKPSELSVAFWCKEAREMIEDKEMLTVRDIDFDTNALVVRGACSPADGAGIGLKKDENEKLEDKKMPDEIKIDKTDKGEKMPTKEEFQEMIKNELEKREHEKLNKEAEEKENKEKEDLQKKVSELEEQIKNMSGTRTTPTREDSEDKPKKELDRMQKLSNTGVAIMKIARDRPFTIRYEKN